MSRSPQFTVPRRTGLGGGIAPNVLRPGELFTQIDNAGQPVLWVGDRRGVPVLYSGGGGGGPTGPATVPTAKPNNPSDGQLWYDAAQKMLQRFDATLQQWEDVFDDTALLAHDGTRQVTGEIDFDGNGVENIVLDAGNW